MFATSICFWKDDEKLNRIYFNSFAFLVFIFHLLPTAVALMLKSTDGWLLCVDFDAVECIWNWNQPFKMCTEMKKKKSREDIPINYVNVLRDRRQISHGVVWAVCLIWIICRVLVGFYVDMLMFRRNFLLFLQIVKVHFSTILQHKSQFH